MAIYKFKDKKFTGYYYNDKDGYVYSTKRPGALYAMKWVESVRWGTHSKRHVSLTATSGIRVNIFECEIGSYLLTTPEPEASTTPVENTSTKLVNDCVAFSAKNKCSQYITKGNTVDAIAKIFKERNLKVDMSDVQIVDTVTGKVYKLQVETVYKLV